MGIQHPDPRHVVLWLVTLPRGIWPSQAGFGFRCGLYQKYREARGAGFCGQPVSQQNGPCSAAIRNSHCNSDAPSSLARSATSSASARVCRRSLCRALCARNCRQYSQRQRHVARLFEPRCANRRPVSSPVKVYLTSSGASESSSAATAALQSAPKTSPTHVYVHMCK